MLGDAPLADTSAGDTLVVDTSAGDTLDTSGGDTLVADTSGTETRVADTSVEDAFALDTFVADSGVDGAADAAMETATDAAADVDAPDLCVGVTCNAPPAVTCKDALTRRTFAATGTCGGGTCAYAPTDTPCPSAQFCKAGSCAPAPSCAGGLTCGSESCCASPLVTGGTFSRSYDNVSPGYLDPQYKATLSDFRLDKYEITVGRFRAFVTARVAGWLPTSGSGKHAHLNAGQGLAVTGGGYEAGWDAAWNSYLPSAKATWDSSSYLACDASYQTWTASPGSYEQYPANCIDWDEAMAFCIWDGGFLPSEAEWNYAAAGGDQQRIYPWGSTTPDTTRAIFGCYRNGTGPFSCTGVANFAPVGTASLGYGRWAQLDLAGSVYEWTADWYRAPFAETDCKDCGFVTVGTSRVARGGNIASTTGDILTSYRNVARTPNSRDNGIGARCARAP